MAIFSYSQQLTFTFIVVSGFVFYYHLFKIQSSGISPEGSSKILPLGNFTEHFPGVDYYINYLASLFHAVNKNLKSASLDQNPKPLHLLIDIRKYQFPISAAKCLTKQQVFIAVISAPGNFENRKVIRETWFLHLSNSSYRFAFIVGLIENRTIQRKIEEENMKYGNIIQVNLIDHYHNLTLKAVGLLNWLNINCPQVLYILKCDDDVYVNVPNFSALLRKISSKELVIYGSYGNTTVDRLDKGKWSLSNKEWPWSTFPSYFLGGSTLITGSSLNPLLEAARVVPFLWIDDVYLSGLLAEKAGVSLRDFSKFLVIDISKYENVCLLIKESTSWLTSFSEQMTVFHTETENYHFNNRNQC